MAIEAVTETVVEEVADNLEELAEATRAINTTAVGYFIGGLCIGAGVGFYFGYRFNRERIKADAFKQSEEEIEKIREMYNLKEQQKTRAELAQQKPAVEEIVKKKGYSSNSPNAATEVVNRPLPAPVPVRDTEGWVPGNAYVEEKSKNDGWDYPAEVARRSPNEPYVIHQDEFRNAETGYSQMTYTYYAEDDVLTGEDDRPVPHGDLVVGQDNLKWGHGADDVDVVFVRNDRLEIEIEICRTPASYEREVLGIDDDEAN